MTSLIIITICTLLLIAYLFDLTASKTKIPSVILLLILGWITRQLADFFNFQPPDISPVLPIVGTIGLILIVLEGSLELELHKSKFKLMKISFLGALIPMLLLALPLAFLLQYYGQISFRAALLNAIPFCVISSAIAIPSARYLSRSAKEYIIYESSLSDIFGVIFFNFIALNSTANLASFGNFGLELLAIAVISFIATIGLSYLLSRIDHHIKFFPIIILIILMYDVLKIYHLPGLIFIMLFGLFIGNLDELKRFEWIQRFKPEKLELEVKKFKELTVEATFLVRALFFLVFGYLIETAEIFNPDTLIWAVGISLSIFLLRVFQLKISGLPLSPLQFVAPRGLITILLFISINQAQQTPLVNKSLIIQVIVISVLTMMFGLMFTKKKKVDIPVVGE